MVPQAASRDKPQDASASGTCASALQPAGGIRRRLGRIRARLASGRSIGLALAALLAASCVRTPQASFFLTDAERARWVRHDDEFRVAGRGASDEAVLFRARFTLQLAVPALPLRVSAFRASSVMIDGDVVKALSAVDRMRLDEATVELPPLEPGDHELVVGVVNRSAHPALRAACPELGLHTGTGQWETSKDGRTWTPAIAVEDARGFEPTATARSTPAAMRNAWPWLLLTALAGAAIAWLRRAPTQRDASVFRTALLIAWVLLSINNVFKIPSGTGMDVTAHVEYVRELAQTWRTPLANEGWERLQPPLFYYVSAILSFPLRIFGPEDLERSLRLVPLLCGAAQIELSYRYAKLFFESKPLHQIVAIACSACIPMSFYMSQFVSNEPLSGVFVGTAILFGLHIIRSDTRRLVEKNALLMGVAMGLACLTKVSAVSLIPCLLAAALLAAWRFGASLGTRLRAPALVVASTLAIAGWFYVRNWIVLGSPFIGGWSWQEIDQEWWQDPSYRVPAHIYRFGESLVHPVYASTRGLWDTLYSTFWVDGSQSGSTEPPPWNWTAALAMTWIGVPLTLAAIVGCFVRLDPRSARLRLVMLGACASVGAAIVAVYVQFPVYSAAKASYALGLMPSFGCLMAVGLSPLLASKAGRSVVGGLLASALAFSFAAYWVVG